MGPGEGRGILPDVHHHPGRRHPRQADRGQRGEARHRADRHAVGGKDVPCPGSRWLQAGLLDGQAGVTVALTGEARKQALASLRRYCAQELDLELEEGDLQMIGLLDFILKEIGPSIYNGAVADAGAFLHARLADLEATKFEPEFTYWPNPPVRRK